MGENETRGNLMLFWWEHFGHFGLFVTLPSCMVLVVFWNM